MMSGTALPRSTATLFEAKTHLSALVSQVEHDHTAIVITRHGKPVAKLVPYDPPTQSPRAEVLAELRRQAIQVGIRYSTEDLIQPLPAELWGEFVDGKPSSPA